VTGATVSSTAKNLSCYDIYSAIRVVEGERGSEATGTRNDSHTRRARGIWPTGSAGSGFLASSEASYVTGASWAADGGMLQMGPQAGSHITTDDWRAV
jgi:hypothetical protein